MVKVGVAKGTLLFKSSRYRGTEVRRYSSQVVKTLEKCGAAPAALGLGNRAMSSGPGQSVMSSSVV